MMRIKPGVRMGMVLGFALFLAGEAKAQPSLDSDAKKQRSKVLFDEGMKVKWKDPKEAIRLFEQSSQANSGDAETRMATCFQIAESHKKLGETASAWSKYLCAAEAARGEGWLEDAREAQWNADSLLPQLCMLKILVPESMSVEGLSVRVNGEAWIPRRWNRAEPVDPGEQRVEVIAPGYEAWSTVVKLEEAGVTRTILVPPFKALPPEKPIPWTGVGVMGGGFLGIVLGLGYDDARRSSREEEVNLREELDGMGVDKRGCVSPMNAAIEKKCEALMAEAVRGNRYLGVETAFLVGGGVALLVGGFMVGQHYLWPSKEEDKKTGVRLLPGPSGTWAGLGVGGVF